MKSIPSLAHIRPDRQITILPIIVQVLVVIAVFIYGLNTTGVEERYNFAEVRHTVMAPAYSKPNRCWIPENGVRWIARACADPKYYYGKQLIKIPARSKFYRINNDLYDMSCHPRWLENCRIEKIIPNVFYVLSPDGETR